MSWPAPDRVLGYAQDSAAHHLLPGSLFAADPISEELVASIPLHGSVMSAIETEDGAAFLVCPTKRVGRTRLVLWDGRSAPRTVRLGRITAGYVDPGTPGDSLRRDPALVALDDVVYVISAREPVAAVALGSGRVSYHRVPGLMKGRLPGSTYPPSGSAGAREVLRREAEVVGRSLLVVSGGETHLARGGLLNEFERVPQLLDVERWRIRRSFKALSEIQTAGRIVLGRSPKGDLVAVRRNGSVLYRRPGRGRSWTLVGTRLLETGLNGRAAVELDLRTGEVLRELGSVEESLYDAFVWPPK